MHYHTNKTENWYVFSGVLKLITYNKIIGEKKEGTISTGHSVIVNKGLIHQLIAIEESDIFEVSNSNNPNDEYRING